MNDLIKENERLKNELTNITKKYQRVQVLVKQQNELNQKTQSEINKMLETISKVDMLEQTNQQLRCENEKLQDALRILQEKYEITGGEVNGRKPVRLRKELTDIASARILFTYMQVNDVAETRKILKEKYGYEIGRAKGFRTVMVTDPKDYLRILTLYRTYREEFGDITESDVIEWYTRRRVKRLKLMTENELIIKFGSKLVDLVLPTVTEDEFVKGYYSQEPFQKAKESK